MVVSKNTWFGILILISIFLVGFFVFSQGSSVAQNNIDPNKEFQVVKLSVEGGSYVMSPSTLKKDVPVRIEADMTKMPGCSKSIVISAFNVRKNLAEGANTIEFTPNKAGTFNIACSMNMYKGSFTVLEDNGSSPVYVESTSTTTGPIAESSCGMANGGGCGCGG